MSQRESWSKVSIIDVIRTPRGKGRPGGALSEVKPIELLEALYRAYEQRAPGCMSALDEVIVGCVTQTGEQGANLAKISALYAGLPDRVGGMTINRFCTSGLDAVELAALKIQAGLDGVSLAGGVESMSRVPIFSDKGSWFFDPQVAQRTAAVQMGFAADVVANLEGFAREELDQWAYQSHQRAALADARDNSCNVLTISGPRGEALISQDELVNAALSMEKIGQQAPAFADERAAAMALERYPQLSQVAALHHRHSSPALADGAALAMLASTAQLGALGVKPRAKILSVAHASVDPVIMLTAAQEAALLAAKGAGVSLHELDIIELNEAFAAIPLRFIRQLNLDEARVNPCGGTIARGHAMGATGAMLLGTLLDELERQDKTLGMVAISGGAGLGSAMVIERCS